MGSDRVIRATEAQLAEYHRRAGEATKARPAGLGWKSGYDAYIRRRDIRAEVMAEDAERGRCTW